MLWSQEQLLGALAHCTNSRSAACYLHLPGFVQEPEVINRYAPPEHCTFLRFNKAHVELLASGEAIEPEILEEWCYGWSIMGWLLLSVLVVQVGASPSQGGVLSCEGLLCCLVPFNHALPVTDAGDQAAALTAAVAPTICLHVRTKRVLYSDLRNRKSFARTMHVIDFVLSGVVVCRAVVSPPIP